MSATAIATTADSSTVLPVCSPESLAVLKEAFEAFVLDPLPPAALSRLKQAVEDLPPADAHFARDLGMARQHQLQRHGGYTQRYVLSKDVGPDGSLRVLPRSIPVRDDTSNKIAKLVRENPSRFPGGIQQLLNAERPLQQAKSADYAKLIAATVRLELDSLLRCDRMKLLKSSATALDLAETYRHLHRISTAHPRVVDTIDRNDTTAMTEFLVTLGSRSPLTESELVRFVTLAADGWQQANDRDQIVRGRVLQSGLDGKTPLLTTWVEPFAAEVVFRGIMPDLQAAFRNRSQAEGRAAAAPSAASAPAKPAAPQKANVPPTTGTFSAPLRAATPAATRPPAPAPGPVPVVTAKAASAVAVKPASANLSDTAPVDVSSTDAFVIPIGVPEPPRLQVLRNYLHVASAATVIRLSEAMRMCEARDDVVGHRQYVQRLFRDAGWAMIGQTKGDPMFSRLVTMTGKASEA
ncbi:MAG: hypothetical protein JNG89_00565 [Planctomycetaceae bacterium]|nr:hypothetical protein [Planctomycetaceae bacterium]